MDEAVSREFAFTRHDFEVLRRLATERSGIVVNDDKFSMFYSRISRRVRALGLRDFRSYCDYVQEPANAPEMTEFINAITTNLTAFFRENHHFEFLRRRALPELVEHKRSRRQVHIWSAGCSTGEEPYSLAMTAIEALPAGQGCRLAVTGTDIDSNVLAQAARGVYALERVTGLPPERLKRWFLKGKGAQAGLVRVKPELRSPVGFGQLNLLDPWQVEDVDMIFCRNVIIYFDAPTKAMLMDRFADTLPVGGYLFVGHSESLHKVTDRFELVGNTVYRKRA